MHSKYNENLAESISMAIKDETEGKHFRKKDDSDMDSVDSFDEYLGSKFGTSIVKSGPLLSKSFLGASKSQVTEKIIVENSVELAPSQEDKMMDFRQNTIDDSIDTFGEDNTARELKPKSFKKEVKKEVKKAKRKMQKSRPRREVSDKELIRKPDYDLRTLERRFCQLKINKLANRVYNREIAKNHRILCSELNKKVLNDVKERIEMKKGRPDRKDCGYCKSYKLKDVRFPMEKVKPLFDDIWIRRPQNENDYKEIEEKNKEIAELQAVVTKIETQEMIQRSINQILYSRINPGAGMMPTY